MKHICGKGEKIRQCLLWPRTQDALGTLVRGYANNTPVFLSRHRKRYTRFGIYRLVERCAAQVPTFAARAITPHVIRHTCACHLLQAGVDLEMKIKAMALCDAGTVSADRPWKEDKGVIAFLNAI
ncbi:MAG: tyrosine-type recombinase/integrase [Gammaproteobacteria bacterium]|nr:tyrosine-type recombinase/integrase [Gammaproteobacteria bacterium]